MPVRTDSGTRDSIDHVAAGERELRHARGFERRLNVHAVIDDVGDELRVGLRLVPAAHDAEGAARRPAVPGS